jgi:hypothetical protein
LFISSDIIVSKNRCDYRSNVYKVNKESDLGFDVNMGVAWFSVRPLPWISPLSNGWRLQIRKSQEFPDLW